MRMHNGTQKHYLCYMRFASSPLAEGDISPSAGRGRTTSHPCGYGPSCQGTLLDPEGPMNPMPLPTRLPCSPP